MVALMKPDNRILDTIIQGDCLEVLRAMPTCSVDAIVTDPPAGISFMGKDWDANKGSRDIWINWLSLIMAECLRVLKPGGFGFVWALPRTSHWTALALEDAGFTIREKCYHLFGSGFPKSKNLGNGVGSALKPAVEEWILCRKPLSESSLEANYAKWGTGGLNIDACRVGTEPRSTGTKNPHAPSGVNGIYGNDSRTDRQQRYDANKPSQRFPSNLLLSHSLFCVPLGMRKVKGNGPSPKPEQKTPDIYNLGLSLNSPVSYRGEDGTETIEAWECHKGGIVTLPSYEYGNAVLSPLSELSYLLDQLQSLLEVLHNCSKNDNIRLNSEDAAAHIACISQVDFSDGLAHDLDGAENHLHELAHALGVSQFVGSLFDCPSCLRLCGEYAHRLVTSFQDGLPSLADALSHVYHCLVEHVHSQHYQEHVQPNGDDFQHVDTLADKQKNKTSVSQHSSGKSETLSHMQGTLFESLQPVALHDNSQENKTSDSDRRETLCHNNCKSELVRLLAFLSFDLLSHVLPIDIIQQKAIDINTSPCPIRLLDEQSGIRNSHGTAAKATFKGMFGNGKPVTGPIREADKGGASRYFTQFSPQDEVPIPFLYQSKASRTERNRGCEGLPEHAIDRYGECGQGPTPQQTPRVTRYEGNNHPTVKPLALMSWLCRLITPPGGTVLDCFAGSGGTLCAAIYEGFHFIGIEQEASYVEIARARVRHAWEVQP